jgi:hypothetical protein
LLVKSHQHQQHQQPAAPARVGTFCLGFMPVGSLRAGRY